MDVRYRAHAGVVRDGGEAHMSGGRKALESPKQAIYWSDSALQPGQFLSIVAPGVVRPLEVGGQIDAMAIEACDAGRWVVVLLHG